MTKHLCLSRSYTTLMKTRSRYRLIFEDEGRLENIASVSASGPKWLAGSIVVLIFIMVIGALVTFLTPARRLLPGYLKESERSATEMQLVRLDSIRMAYETNAAFIENLQFVLNPTLHKRDTVAAPAQSSRMSSDSLLPTSREEAKFAAMMREREKYNVSVVAPLAAESMMFSPVNAESVVSQSSKSEKKAEIILAAKSTVSAIADGTVIAVSQSLKDGGTVVIIQHPKGFLSRLSRLGSVLVEPGDIVTGGQIIALSNRGNAHNGEIINLEMWHNGNPLIPYEYIGDGNSDSYYPKIYKKDVEEERL